MLQTARNRCLSEYPEEDPTDGRLRLKEEI